MTNLIFHYEFTCVSARGIGLFPTNWFAVFFVFTGAAHHLFAQVIRAWVADSRNAVAPYLGKQSGRLVIESKRIGQCVMDLEIGRQT
jgi:hypothetical protein